MNAKNIPESTPSGPAACIESAEDVSRRTFFRRISLTVGGCLGLGLAAPLAGFILAPLMERKPEVWRTVGKTDDFKIGQTVAVRYEDPSAVPWAGVTARTAAWLRREDVDQFIAFSINCTHLGCPVRWMPQANLFLCPCHGGVYYQDGRVAAGPPDRPLARYPVRIAKGQVQIKTAPLPILRK
jgi:menaquinol-cytochrome c reductase iron-sulfur subunit